MEKLAAPIIILAGAIAVGCGTIANAINHIGGDEGYMVGTVLLIVGGLMLLKPLWDAIPVDGGKQVERPPKSVDEDDSEQ